MAGFGAPLTIATVIHHQSHFQQQHQHYLFTFETYQYLAHGLHLDRGNSTHHHPAVKTCSPVTHVLPKQFRPTTNLQPSHTHAISSTPRCDLSVPALALLWGGPVYDVFPLPDHGRRCRHPPGAHRKDTNANVLGARSSRERRLHVRNPQICSCTILSSVCGTACPDCMTVHTQYCHHEEKSSSLKPQLGLSIYPCIACPIASHTLVGIYCLGSLAASL